MGRKKKKTSPRKFWNISLTSAFMVFYTAIIFGLDQIFISLLNGGFNLSQSVQIIRSKMNMGAFVNVLTTGIQLKLMATIAKALSGGTIGQFWKIKLRW